MAHGRARACNAQNGRVLDDKIHEKGSGLSTENAAGGVSTSPLVQTHRRQVPLRGYIIVLSGTVIWALTGIVIKILLTRYGMDPLIIAFWRVLIVTAFLFVALAILDPRHLRLDRRDLVIFIPYGLIGVAIHQLVWITSVQYNGAAVATVIIYTSPAIVALFATRFLHEKMDRTRLTALAITIAGCV